MKKSSSVNLSEQSTGHYDELERSLYSALETYSNVHRGSGHSSMVTSHLFEQARDIILDYLELKKNSYVLIFCTPRRASLLIAQLGPKSYKVFSSQEIGLSLGVVAVAIKKRALHAGAPSQTGGGTTRLISREWIIWAKAPDKFEAGTPAIINIIGFAKALQMVRKYGSNIFQNANTPTMSATNILYHDELDKHSGKELLAELRLTLIGRNMPVPTMEGIRYFINLDNSASTPTFAPIWNTFRHTLSQNALVQQEIVNETRSICADMLGAPLSKYDLIFTSNTTESINLAAESFGRDPEKGTDPVVLNTILEHSSNDLPWRMVPHSSLIRLSVNDDGFVDLNEMETLLRTYNHEGSHGNKRIRLVALSGASNVLGVCNDIEAIGRIVHKYKAKLLVDAAQLIAHRKVDMEASGIDYLAFSAHKIYAPFGCGVLLARKNLLKFSAAELEQINASGEQNVAGIAALGKAFLLLKRIGMENIKEEEQTLTGRAMSGLSEIPGLRIYGIRETDPQSFDRKLGVIVFSLKGTMADKIAGELTGRFGIGVRYGCHCAHIIVKHILNVGPGLEKFQRLMLTLLPKVQLPGITRVSLGIENTKEDVDRLIYAVGKIAGLNSKESASDDDSSQHLSKADLKLQNKAFVSASAERVYS